MLISLKSVKSCAGRLTEKVFFLEMHKFANVLFELAWSKLVALSLIAYQFST